MNRQEFAKGIRILELTYNQKFDKEKRDFWYRQLQDLEAKRYFDNIKQTVKTSTFMPNIAQIRNETSRAFVNYEQRDYSDLDFESLYANQKNIAKE